MNWNIFRQELGITLMVWAVLIGFGGVFALFIVLPDLIGFWPANVVYLGVTVLCVLAPAVMEAVERKSD